MKQKLNTMKQNNSRPHKPVGYVRVKVHSQSIIFSSLIDSGNLCKRSLISEELCETLKLPTSPYNGKLNTAGENQNVKIVGVVAPFRIFIEGLKMPVTINPLVVRNLSHHLNLGARFLRENRAKLLFHPDKVELKIAKEKIILQAGKDVMKLDSSDEKFAQVLKKYSKLNPHTNLSKKSIVDLQLQAENEPLSLPGITYTKKEK